jgi:glycosyltransferase involved in cell wall biosynthesis
MRILLLTFYFQPDLSAGSFRATALLKALCASLLRGDQIDVITTEPNRYSTYTAAVARDELAENVTIHRVKLPAHRSDMAGQARAFLHFARQASQQVRGRKYDLVYATSSRLMTAALGAHIARRLRAPLYLDIRDIFVETIGDVLPGVAGALVRPVFSQIERRTIRTAARVNLVSRGFEGYFATRYPDRKYSWFTNGIDDEFLDAGAPTPAAGDDPRVKILYAGNLGESQALHYVLPDLARALESRARFIVIGDGGRRAQLEAALAASGVTNVELRAPVPRHALIAEYRAADVLFLHLGAQPAFERVLPSKLFEYAALGKPVLAGVGGFAARFVAEEIRNSAVFSPCDSAGGVRAFESLDVRHTPRPEFIEKFARTNIARRMADEILAMARDNAKGES